MRGVKEKGNGNI